MECSECLLSVPGLFIDGELTHDCPFDVPDDCHLTLAAMRLVRLLIEKGISDDDAAVVERAIAGEGRLAIADKPRMDYGYVDPKEQREIDDAYEYYLRGQDQGGE